MLESRSRILLSTVFSASLVFGPNLLAQNQVAKPHLNPHPRKTLTGDWTCRPYTYAEVYNCIKKIGTGSDQISVDLPTFFKKHPQQETSIVLLMEQTARDNASKHDRRAKSAKEAVQILAHIGNEQSSRIVEAILDDKNTTDDVRAEAARTTGKLSKYSPATSHLTVQKLKNVATTSLKSFRTSGKTFEGAVSGLGSIPTLASGEALVDIMKKTHAPSKPSNPTNGMHFDRGASAAAIAKAALELSNGMTNDAEWAIVRQRAMDAILSGNIEMDADDAMTLLNAMAEMGKRALPDFISIIENQLIDVPVKMKVLTELLPTVIERSYSVPQKGSDPKAIQAEREAYLDRLMVVGRNNNADKYFIEALWNSLVAMVTVGQDANRLLIANAYAKDTFPMGDAGEIKHLVVGSDRFLNSVYGKFDYSKLTADQMNLVATSLSVVHGAAKEYNLYSVALSNTYRQWTSKLNGMESAPQIQAALNIVRLAPNKVHGQVSSALGALKKQNPDLVTALAEEKEKLGPKTPSNQDELALIEMIEKAN